MNAYPISAATQARLDQPFLMLIDGERCTADAGEEIPVINPATEQEIARIPAAAKADIDKAVSAAERAFKSGAWTAIPPGRRSQIMWKIGDLIEARSAELAELETLDNGKPLAASRAMDIPMAASIFRYWAGWCNKIAGTTPIVDLPIDLMAMTLKQPVGVVGLIVPWNFPLLNAVVKLGPAMAAGCTIVLKPAEQASLTTLCLAEILVDAGVPAGVVNIVTGYGATAGACIASHPSVAKISFTGSTGVGKQLIHAAQGNLKRLTLELGGKSPALVLGDADLDRAIPSVANGIFKNAGQVCAAGSRLLVHRSRYDEVVSGVVREAEKLVLGNGLDSRTTLGPVISSAQHSSVQRHIRTAASDGGEILTGGGSPRAPGYFIEPTVIAADRPNMEIVTDEVFGPVLVAMPFDDIEEAISLANGTEFGLSANVWTRDMSNALKLSRALQAGTVTINSGMIAGPGLPFGGVKQSGWGREGGQEGLDAYLETKTVVAAI